MNLPRLFFPLATSLLAVVYGLLYAPYFDPSGTIGHDYSFFLPALLDGYYWYLNNGLINAPWFTPAFCAGIPAFSDPQGIYYSLWQWLTVLLNPLQAIQAAMVIGGIAGFAGMYAYCVHSLRLSRGSSALAGCLWMFNSFVAHHYLVGHITFLPFMLVPLIAFLIDRAANRNNSLLLFLMLTGMAGLLVASTVHAGMGSLIVPFGLAVWMLLELALMAQPDRWKGVYGAAAAAALWSAALAAAKLVAIAALVSNVPRTQYRLPAFIPSTLPESLMSMLMRPDEEIAATVLANITNLSVALAPHEVAFNLTPIPFVLIGAVLLLMFTGRIPPRFGQGRSSLPHAALTLMILSILLAINCYQPEWNALLKKTPILASTSGPWRWLAALLPLLCALGALSLEQLATGKLRTAAAALLVLLCIVLHISSPRESYSEQAYDLGPVLGRYRQIYDPQPVLAAYAEAKEPGFTPGIRHLGTHIGPDKKPIRVANQNDLLTRRISQAFCYNPVFGYMLENLDMDGLGPGNPLRVTDGHLNFKNPACYVFPTENSCEVGDRFSDTALDREHAEALLAYRPWPFERSTKQALASGITQIALLGLLGLVIAGIARSFLARR